MTNSAGARVLCEATQDEAMSRDYEGGTISSRSRVEVRAKDGIMPVAPEPHGSGLAGQGVGEHLDQVAGAAGRGAD